ncbi:hypothetical protein A3Q56_05945 [Intoshia linei]|uniref:Palmitoyltransferase n=1 Tax=Intoshia linei TaxID=1819745 RepID=A0A177AY48_9BILA|nr:hypothetical protein A3Q56_05945 [Intoshia linei]
MRTKHCYKCGYCVRKYDHHCLITGKCVGENNQKNFFLFLLIHFIVSSCAPFYIWPNLISTNWADEKKLNYFVYFEIALLIVSFIFFIFTTITVFVLICIQTYLICTNCTMREYMNDYRIDYLKKIDDPFDEGILKNIWYWLRHNETIWESKYLTIQEKFENITL